MSATAVITGARLNAEYGCYTGMTVEYTVRGLTSSTMGELLTEAAAATPSYLTEFSQSSNLVVTKKSIDIESFANTNAKVCKVTVEYTPYGQLQDQWVWRFRDGLEQRNINTDILGNQITVEYTYPDDYALRPELAGATVQAGGSVTTLRPTAEMVGSKIIQVDDPISKGDEWRGKTNSTAWNGLSAGICMVSSVVHELLDISTTPYKYLFTVTISINPAGYNKLVAFTDPNTGEVPPDVVPGVGTTVVVTRSSMDYNIVWPY